MNKMALALKSLVTLLSALMLLGAVPAMAQQSVEGTIQGGVAKPLSIVVPDFLTEGTATTLQSGLADLVANDLASTGLFDPSRMSAIVENFNAPVEFSAIPISEAYLLASIAQTPDGSLRVKFRLFDSVAQKEVGDGIQFTGSINEWRRVGHKIADEVYTRLTGEGKYFDSKIVFVSETGPKNNRRKAIATMDVDGANLRYLTNGQSIVFAPRWAGNTRDVIFTSLANGAAQVVLMNTQTGNVRTLGDLPGLAFAPRVSPDGNQIVVSLIDDSGNTDLYAIDKNTGARARLTSAPSIETAPSFSPDGRQLVFESDASGNQQIYVMPSNGGGATRISSGSGRYATPVWSPRGDLIAFTKIVGGEFQIGVMNSDGSGERILTSGHKDESPSWAPNGRALMFFRETPGSDGAPALYAISLTGRNLVKLTTPDFASDPNWSPLLN